MAKTKIKTGVVVSKNSKQSEREEHQGEYYVSVLQGNQRINLYFKDYHMAEAARVAMERGLVVISV